MIVGNSPEMLRVAQQVARVARTNVAILVQGESGTGKRMLVLALHQLSLRKDGPLEVVDCAALPEHLVESELFGHVRGAFTGAIASREGAFERACGGTIHLPDITEMPLSQQPKLLRVLQDRKIRKVGGARDKDVDVRVIADTNKDIEAQVQAGAFRDDLCSRLNVFGILLPPLREHLSDVPLLVEHFIARHRADIRQDIEGISPEALEMLGEYAFPRNVRELENIVIFSMIDESGTVISADTVRQKLRPSGARAPEDASNGRLRTERELVEDETVARWEMFEHNVSRTAASLGRDPKTVRQRIARHETRQRRSSVVPT